MNACWSSLKINMHSPGAWRGLPDLPCLATRDAPPHTVPVVGGGAAVSPGPCRRWGLCREAGRRSAGGRGVMTAVSGLPGGGNPEHGHPHREDGGRAGEGGLGGGRRHGDRRAQVCGVQVVRRRHHQGKLTPPCPPGEGVSQGPLGRPWGEGGPDPGRPACARPSQQGQRGRYSCGYSRLPALATGGREDTRRHGPGHPGVLRGWGRGGHSVGPFFPGLLAL